MNLAPLRYRRVFGPQGGPVDSCSCTAVEVLGRRLYQANATLVPRLRPIDRNCVLYANADGTGTAERPYTARHRAISEALERWAHHETWSSARRADFGFTVDPSTNGMAAFPGLLARQARGPALAEAAERFCQTGWWVGGLRAEPLPEIQPGIEAWQFENPLSHHAVVLLHATVTTGDHLFHSYAAGTGRGVSAAVRRAAIELARNCHVLRLNGPAALLRPPAGLLERRLLHFASAAGHAEFRERMARRPARTLAPRVVFDGPIPGPWSRYADVWRVAVAPVSAEFLDPRALFFFW